MVFSKSQFEKIVEKATDENNTEENWTVILEVCDEAKKSLQNSTECLRCIIKRLNSQNPHIVKHALTLLDACADNCGKPFHLAIASREFVPELTKLIQHKEPKLAEKSRALLKKWAEGDFKKDTQLGLITTLYNDCKKKKIDFSVSDPPKSSSMLSDDPNVVTDSKEAEDIAKAIHLSLQQSKAQSQASSSHSSPVTKKSSSLYPNVSSAIGAASTSEGRKVRALYDFEAAEDNELTFLTGEIINVLDDSDPNWWKGSNQRGEGLFPANFVTADLSVEPEEFTKLEHSNKKLVQFADEVEVKTMKREPDVIDVEIDEKRMDRLLHLLHEADPESDASDPQEMIDLEEQVTAMGPLIDAALEKVDRRHAQLTKLSSDLVEALNLYHTLMRESLPPALSNYALPKMPHMHPYFQSQGPPPPHMFNGMPPPHQPPFPPGGAPPGHYNAGIPGNEFVGTVGIPNMTLPSHYHVQSGHHQHPPGHLHGPPVSEQTSLPYQPTGGYRPQTSTAPGSFGPPGPTGPSINQQPQYAPPNGQHMM